MQHTHEFIEVELKTLQNVYQHYSKLKSGQMKFTSLSGPSLTTLYYYTLSFFNLCLGAEKSLFIKNTLVLHVYPIFPSPWNDGHDIFNIFSSYHANDTDQSVLD